MLLSLVRCSLSALFFFALMRNVPQTNRQYVADFVGNLLLSSFPNLTKVQVAGFVSGLLNGGMDLTTFKLHLRDFLVTLKVSKVPSTAFLSYIQKVFFFFCVCVKAWMLEKSGHGGLANGIRNRIGKLSSQVSRKHRSIPVFDLRLFLEGCAWTCESRNFLGRLRVSGMMSSLLSSTCV